MRVFQNLAVRRTYSARARVRTSAQRTLHTLGFKTLDVGAWT